MSCRLMLINMNEAEFEAVLSTMPPASVTAGQHRDEKREEWLSAESGATAPVLWVNDIQVAAPLIRDAESEFAGIGAQMNGLRALAKRTGAIVAVGHCASAGEMEDWDAVLQGSDNTFAIEFSDEELFSQQRPRRATVEHHSSGGPAYTFERVIDTRFADWRSMMLRSE